MKAIDTITIFIFVGAFTVYYNEYKSSSFVRKVGHVISYQSLGLITLVGAFTVGDTWDKLTNGVITAGAVFTIHFLFFLGLIFLRYSPNRESRTHGQLIISLGDKFALIHEVRKQYAEINLELEKVPFIDNKTEKEDRLKLLSERKSQIDDGASFALSNICDGLANHFCKKSKSICCVSIKVIKDLDYASYRDAIVYNESRDTDHVKKRDTKIYKDQKHTIEGNTSFSEVAAKVDDPNETEYAFIHGAINDDPYYKNTSKVVYEGNPLPYNSELVVPLVPSKDQDPILIGFLCVDSDKKNRFGKLFDAAVMKGVADGIYDVIMNKRSKIVNHDN